MLNPQVLQRLTGLNMNVIMVIHQPRYEIFECFDAVLLLAAGGLTLALALALALTLTLTLTLTRRLSRS